MAAEFTVVFQVFGVLLDDTYAFHFIEEVDDDLPMFSMAAWPEKSESVSWVFRTNSTLLFH